MKVVFNNGDAVNLSAIESLDVSDTDDNVEIVVHYQTRRTEKVSYITFRSPIHFNPNKKTSRELIKEIVAEIKALIGNQTLSIEHVIDLKVWRIGCLSVNLNTTTDSQKTIALARLCVSWGVGRRNAPTHKQLEVRTGLDTDTIQDIAATDNYKQCVKELLLKGSLFEPRTAEEFKTWVEEYYDMPRRFGKRMRLSEEASKTLINEIASTYGFKDLL